MRTSTTKTQVKTLEKIAKLNLHNLFISKTLILFFLSLFVLKLPAQEQSLLKTLIQTNQEKTVAASANSCGYGIYRSYDGKCNNSLNQDWGAAETPFRRVFPAQYGPPKFKEAYSGQGRLNPRAISNYVSIQNRSIPNTNQLSAFVFTWGQFLDHDITETPSNPEETEVIPLPENEPLFRVPLSFTRSLAYPETGETNPRQQMNAITAWIDASNVYGSDEERAHWLRTRRHGKLKTSAGNLLPFNTTDGQFHNPIDPHAPMMAGNEDLQYKVFVAGDVRANEQPGLTALHTLFVREHNRICDGLIRAGYYDDEGNYQIARKIVGAHMQNITFNEFLPALGIHLDDYTGYQQLQQPDISNLFATAAFRLGHTMVNDGIVLLDNYGNIVDALPLSRAFFNPQTISQYGIEPAMMGLSRQRQEEVDLKVVNTLRNFLFAPNPNSPGLDLVALNIQRGRDHGLPDYNTVRMQVLGAPAHTWSDITSDVQLQQQLANAYGNNLNDIDLWVGLLAEDHAPGMAVGATVAQILKSQFSRLRDADRFYYEIDPVFTSDPTDWTSIIGNTKLADIIRRNSNLSNIAQDVFRVNGSNSNLQNQEGFPLENRSLATKEQAVLSIDYQVFPNPTSGNISIELEADELQEVRLQIVNLEGKVVYTNEFEPVKTYYAKDLDISFLPKGIYFIQLQTDMGYYSERVVLQ